jgi:hypothetical protein
MQTGVANPKHTRQRERRAEGDGAHETFRERATFRPRWGELSAERRDNRSSGLKTTLVGFATRCRKFVARRAAGRRNAVGGNRGRFDSGSRFS